MTDQKPTIVYQAVNLINGKRYIGITMREFRVRIWQHKSAAKLAPNKGCRIFNAAIRKYGFDAIRFSIITHTATFEDACEMEKRLIASWKPEYNITSGGQGTPGRILSQEARARISAFRKGTAAPNKGIPHSEQTKEKIRQKAIGRKWTATQRTAVEHSNQNRNHPLSKSVICLTTGEVFQSATAASKHYGWENTAVANGIRKHYGLIKGLRFHYADEPPNLFIPGPRRGVPMSKETKGILSKIFKGRPCTNPGYRHSEEVKDLLRQRAKGKSMLPQTKEAMAVGLEKFLKERGRRAVICLTTGKEFSSATEASIFYGWKPYAVSNAISKVRGKTKGFTFAYKAKVAI